VSSGIDSVERSARGQGQADEPELHYHTSVMAHRELDQSASEKAANPASSSGGETQLLPEYNVMRLLSQPSWLSHLSDIVSVIDRELRFLYVSRTAGDRRLSDVLGRSVLEHIAPPHREQFRACFAEAWQSGEPRVVEASSNDETWWENRLVPVRDEDGAQLMLVMTVDITQRVLAEHARKESEQRLRHALDVSGVGTWSWRLGDGRVSWDDNIGRILEVGSYPTTWDFDSVFQLIHEDDRERVRAHAEKSLPTGVYEEIEYRILRPSGEQRHVVVRGARLELSGGTSREWRGSMIDVTDRKRIEEHLRQVHKMEAVGQLTAGIAHNFNNLLGIILPTVWLCRTEATPFIKARLDDIEHTAERAAELVRQLMTFARSEGSKNMCAFDLRAAVERTLGICRATFDPATTIEFRAPATPQYVFGRAGDIEQVLLNVLLNARDALSRPDQENSRLLLRLECRARTLHLEVDDDGPGIPQALLARVFEPFFTTKEIGKGTGLGLATAYAIVSEHKGTIAAGVSSLGGARIVIELPACDAPAPLPV
jgi:PAS domain S-box-containing protein